MRGRMQRRRQGNQGLVPGHTRRCHLAQMIEQRRLVIGSDGFGHHAVGARQQVQVVVFYHMVEHRRAVGSLNAFEQAVGQHAGLPDLAPAV